MKYAWKVRAKKQTMFEFGVHIAAVLGRATPCSLVDRY